MLTCLKDEFSLPQEVHYLNCAYMAPLSARVEAAGLEGIKKKRNPDHINPHDFFADSNRARGLFGRIIHAEPSSVALIPSVSYGIASIARNLSVRSGQSIVVVEEQFPSNVYAWSRLAVERGAEIVTVGPDVIRRLTDSHPTKWRKRPSAPDALTGRAARWNERILETIDSSTAVVAMSNVHWADGTLFDIQAIAERAHGVGAAFVIDGTQSVGALPFDVREVRPDALICAGYKWLLGPYAIGLAYFDEKHHRGSPLEETWISRRNSETFSALVDYEDAYQPGAQRYDVGERSNFILVPMLCAALEHILEWTVPGIQSYCRDLMSEMIDEAREIGYRIEDERGRSHHLFGIRLPPEVSADDLNNELTARNVAVSIRGNAVRVSPHVYNDSSDVAALRDSLFAAAGR